MTKLIGKPVKTYKENCLDILMESVISGKMEKSCCKCKMVRNIHEFGILLKSLDGHRYDCNICRKQYRDSKKIHIQQKNQSYYRENKETMLSANKTYRSLHIDEINRQRKEYRNQPEIKEHVKRKNKEYLPVKKEHIKEKRKTDLKFQLSEVMRSKLHKLIKNQPTSYKQILGCEFEFFKKWIEFRFDKNMSWNNFGSYWHIDHILPINGFEFTDEKDKQICFHWTNLQPLSAIENRLKSDKLQLHYYFNNIVNIHRYNQSNKQFLGYQAVNESLQWLRSKLRYGNNPSYADTIVSKIGNPQPSSYVHSDKNMEKVQRLNGDGSEDSNQI